MLYDVYYTEDEGVRTIVAITPDTTNAEVAPSVIIDESVALDDVYDKYENDEGFDSSGVPPLPSTYDVLKEEMEAAEDFNQLATATVHLLDALQERGIL